MELDKLQIDLRPRPNAQALDLGFALLRMYAGKVYMGWLMLWLPTIALCCGLAFLFPAYSSFWLVLAWWVKPLLERAPLYILSRQVFGEEVTWQAALRAWPRQLGGGWFRLLTWWRPFAAGRGLFQPIWQLEGARGEVAAMRRQVIGRDHTLRSAFWFGVVCAHFEVILQFGLLAFIGFFLGSEQGMNPFAFMFEAGKRPDAPLTLALTYLAYAVSGGVISPIYTACCFTLYLNRRATLEAWDIEIMLRQIKPPQLKSAATVTCILSLPVCLLVASMVLTSYGTPAQAIPSDDKKVQSAAKCTKPESEKNRSETRDPDRSVEQAKLREEGSRLFQTDELRTYVCEESWELKKKPDVRPPGPKDSSRVKLPSSSNLAVLAEIIKILLIAGVIGIVIWLLYRYRGHFGALLGSGRAPKAATEIGGLDIRPESLPDDVAAVVRRLWANDKRRAALALLYRATLSRLASEDGLQLTQGATEDDCLRLANYACRQQRLDAARLQVAATATALWLNGAYGNRWPDTAIVDAGCTAWEAQFGLPRAVSAGIGKSVDRERQS